MNHFTLLDADLRLFDGAAPDLNPTPPAPPA